ncbi:TPA: hypothetical protein ACPTVC_004234 [Escherichia coli]
MSAWSPEHITLRRTENGNVIAHDSRDDQEFIFAEVTGSFKPSGLFPPALQK